VKLCKCYVESLSSCSYNIDCSYFACMHIHISSSSTLFNIYCFMVACLGLDRNVVFPNLSVSVIIHSRSQLLHIPSNTLAMSSYLYIYQPYLLPPTADNSLPRNHQTSSPHVQFISICYVLQP